MTNIHHIVNSESISDLDDAGVMSTAMEGSTPRARVKSLKIPGWAKVDTGVWECSPGIWRRATPDAEVMHFVAGECSFTPDGGITRQIRAGDTVVLPMRTEGVWEVKSTVRKIYVTLSEPDVA
jgi:uncharacterized cupin superfamily protein